MNAGLIGILLWLRSAFYIVHTITSTKNDASGTGLCILRYSYYRNITHPNVNMINLSERTEQNTCREN